ncbi:MAG TPA: hypothetical protein VFH88_05375, partial [Candidatus Krumholzibacteria bacterium]|nr:hypothetical protein [Candidatus Krumholzibacteria bacterium]
DGKRQPMGALMFLYDRPTHTMRCEFTRPNAHGIWSFAAQGDSLVGQLVLLPDYEKVRDVHAHRVLESDVPKAPPLSDYDE